MSEELKLCPMCESKSKLCSKEVTRGKGGSHVMWYAQCSSNDCVLGPLYQLWPEEARKSWNNRPIEDKLRAEIERLRGYLGEWETRYNLGQLVRSLDENVAFNTLLERTREALKGERP